jgi:alkanesulfonate monooxygenase SsuD/methylene tetrahydromethanopterin reductase-like flavin-dependent oxidoreductase (luciferase family)
LPILIGGSGEKVTLRLVAEHADAWNTFGPPANFAHKNRVLDEWCARANRNPRHVERTVAINANEVDDWQAYADAGADHLIVMAGPPFDLDPVRRLLDAVRA